MRGGLPVCAADGCILRRPRCPLHDRVDVAGLCRVEDDATRVGADVEQHLEYASVQFDTTRRGQRVDDGAPRELVPELHRLGPHGEQPGLLGGAQGPRPTGNEAGKLRRTDNRRHDGKLLHARLRCEIEAAQAGGDRIDHGARHVRGIRRRDEFTHEVRVTARQGEHAVWVDSAVRGELADGSRRQPPKREVAHVRPEVAEQPAERMPAVELLVAIGEHQHGVERVDAPGDEAQRIEGRLVGPVHVFDDEHGAGRRGEFVAERGEDLLAVAGSERIAEPRSDERRQVAQRPERARRRQRVTGPDEHAAPDRRPLAKGAHEAGLPDARLAVDQQHATASLDRCPHRVVELGEFGIALEQPHSAIVLAPGRDRNAGSEPRVRVQSLEEEVHHGEVEEHR